jgi:S1-C subfamily serine protease
VTEVLSMSLDYPRPARSSPASYLWPLLFAALLGFVAWRLWPRHEAGLNPAAEPRTVTPRGDLMELEKTTIKVFRDVSPSVVHITTLAQQENPFSGDVQQVPEGTGSGFIWDDQGHVVTNFHVIRNAEAAKVTLADHSTWDARLVGALADNDLAVLGIAAPKSKLHPIAVGTSNDLQVGQSAFAIGNPFGLDQTLTRGLVSALGREITSVNRRPIRGVIQTDAAINPGNSGGPLLDSAGRLIGVNTAIFSPSGASAGIGFAIPVDDVNRVVTELIRHGKVVKPRLGIVPVPDQYTEKWGVTGVLIADVQPGSPAEKAGLQATRRTRRGEIVLGDVIVAIDGKPIETTRDLFAVLDTKKVGDTVTVTITRDGEKQDVSIKLEAPTWKL